MFRDIPGDPDALIQRAARQAVRAAAFPDNPDARLTRDAVAAALTAAGYPISPRTLATKATRGGGPPYSKFNTRVLYRWADALAWARSVTSAPCASSAEADAQHGRAA